MTVLWRYAVLASVVFWLGGFTFYISIVVPAGTAQLGATVQGFVTREVTKAINVAACVALGMLLLDTWANADPGPRRRWARRGLWLGMVVLQTVLWRLHPILADMMDADTASVRQRPTFYQWHRLYLWAHTVQWGLALIDLGLMVAAWRAIDRRAVGGTTP